MAIDRCSYMLIEASLKRIGEWTKNICILNDQATQVWYARLLRCFSIQSFGKVKAATIQFWDSSLDIMPEYYDVPNDFLLEAFLMLEVFTL